MTHTVTAAEVRRELLARREVAILDLREEDVFARGHPLFAGIPSGGAFQARGLARSLRWLAR